MCEKQLVIFAKIFETWILGISNLLQKRLTLRLFLVILQKTFKKIDLTTVCLIPIKLKLKLFFICREWRFSHTKCIWEILKEIQQVLTKFICTIKVMNNFCYKVKYFNELKWLSLKLSEANWQKLSLHRHTLPFLCNKRTKIYL